MIRLPAKIGDTFEYLVMHLADDQVTPLAISDDAIISVGVRDDKYEFISMLQVLRTGLPANQFMIFAGHDQTATWPVGDLVFDVKIQSDGVHHSDTGIIESSKVVTP